MSQLYGSYLFSLAAVLSLTMPPSPAMPDDCPVRSKQEPLFREGENYVQNNSTGYSTSGYRDVPQLKINDFSQRETDYLTVPLTTASDILKAEDQTQILESQKQSILADKIRQRIKAARKDLFGPKINNRSLMCISTAERLRRTAWQLEERQNLPLSERSYRGVVELYRTELGDTIYTANALGDLARICDAQGKAAESQRLYANALAIYDRYPQAADADMASVLEYYANFLQKQKQESAAATLFKRAGDIGQRCYAKPHRLSGSSGSPYDPSALNVWTEPTVTITSANPNHSEDTGQVWTVWDQAISKSIHERFSSFARAAFRHSPPLAGEVLYTVTIGNHIADISLISKSSNVLLNVLMFQAIKSLEGNPILQFPPGATGLPVSQTAKFAVKSNFAIYPSVELPVERPPARSQLKAE